MKLSEMTTYECAKALTHDEYANWTRSGAFALVEYLEQMEDDCGTQIEFDPSPCVANTANTIPQSKRQKHTQANFTPKRPRLNT